MTNKLSLRHFLHLFLSVALISCTGEDESDSGSNSVDPLIGTWTTSYVDEGVTYTDQLIVRANGTLTFLDDFLIEDGMIEEGTVNDTWMNAATNPNFSNTTQNYVFGSDIDGDSSEVLFNSDFTTFYDTGDDERIFSRQ